MAHMHTVVEYILQTLFKSKQAAMGFALWVQGKLLELPRITIQLFPEFINQAEDHLSVFWSEFEKILLAHKTRSSKALDDVSMQKTNLSLYHLERGFWAILSICLGGALEDSLMDVLVLLQVLNIPDGYFKEVKTLYLAYICTHHHRGVFEATVILCWEAHP